MNRRSYVVLAGSLLTAGCIGTGTTDSSSPTATSALDTESEAESTSSTTTASDSATSQSGSEGYSGFSGGIIDEKLGQSSNPPTLPRGEPITVRLTVSNEEGARTSYIVAVQLQKYEYTDSNGEKRLEVITRQTLTRSSLTVENGDQKSVNPSVTVDEVGENYRFVFLMYKSTAPDTMSEKTASNSFVIPVTITDDA